MNNIFISDISKFYIWLTGSCVLGSIDVNDSRLMFSWRQRQIHPEFCPCLSMFILHTLAFKKWNRNLKTVSKLTHQKVLFFNLLTILLYLCKILDIGSTKIVVSSQLYRCILDTIHTTYLIKKLLQSVIEP